MKEEGERGGGREKDGRRSRRRRRGKGGRRKRRGKGEGWEKEQEEEEEEDEEERKWGGGEQEGGGEAINRTIPRFTQHLYHPPNAIINWDNPPHILCVVYGTHVQKVIQFPVITGEVWRGGVRYTSVLSDNDRITCRQSSCQGVVESGGEGGEGGSGGEGGRGGERRGE